MTVLDQLRLCRNTEVLHPVTNRKESPRNVTLITTYPITDSHTSDAHGILDQIAAAGVTIISPDTLVDLICDNLPDFVDSVLFPGRNLAGALARYLDVHHEHTAFGLVRPKSMSAFFVHLTIEPLAIATLLQLIAMEESSRFRRFAEIPSDILSRYLSSQFVMSPPLKTAKVIEPAKPLGDRLSSNSSEEEVQKMIVDRKAIIDMASDDKDITIIAPQISRLLESLRRFSKKEGRDFVSRFAFVTQLPEALQYLSTIVGYCLPRGSLPPDTTKGSAAPHSSLSCMTLGEVGPADLATIDDNLCIVGEAGAGKTTTVKSLALEFLRKGIPTVYFPCSQIRDPEKSAIQVIHSFVSDISEKPSANAAKGFVDTAKVIILDGLDEAHARADLAEMIMNLSFAPSKQSVAAAARLIIPKDLHACFTVKTPSKGKYTATLIAPLTANDKNRMLLLNSDSEAWSTALRSMFADSRKKRVIVSTRRSSIDRVRLPRDFVTLNIQPMSDVQQAKFFRRWFTAAGKKSSANAVIQYLAENRHLKDICRTPLVATLVASLYERGFNLPRSKTEVYERRFCLLCGEWDEKRSVERRNQILPRDKEMFLAKLAWGCHSSRRCQFAEQEARIVWDSAFRRIYRSITFEQVLSELIDSNNLIVKEGGNEFSLGHLSYQEFLAARYARDLQMMNVLIDRCRDPWWKEVVLFFVGLGGDSSPFIEKYAEERVDALDSEFVDQLNSEGLYTEDKTRRLSEELSYLGDDDIWDDV